VARAAPVKAETGPVVLVVARMVVLAALAVAVARVAGLPVRSGWVREMTREPRNVIQQRHLRAEGM
jgi:hypothetical protein